MVSHYIIECKFHEGRDPPSYTASLMEDVQQTSIEQIIKNDEVIMFE